MIGYLAAAGASLGLGLSIALVRYAFEGGTNGVTVALLRTAFVFAGAALYCYLSRRSFRLPWRVWVWCVLLGFCMANMFYANLAAVQFIPIGLAALLFFTYPPMVGIGNALVARRWPSGVMMLALGLAFAGLALMLGASIGGFHVLGMLLSLSAALATAGNVIGSAIVMAKYDRWVVFFHMAAIAAVTLLLVALVQDAIVAPVTPGGWAGLIGVAALQGSSIPLFYVALARIGPERCAMFNNLQPVVSIVAAYLLFAELLTPLQFAGAALVFGGIGLMQFQHRLKAGAGAGG